MDNSIPGTVSLKLEKDLYVQNNTGFFETDCIGKAKDKPDGDFLDPPVYYPDSMDGVSITIDMNGHTIYGDKTVARYSTFRYRCNSFYRYY